jgi:catechol 2,3-dioxygenase-like lactoylglutathione lyase family enzyme
MDQGSAVTHNGAMPSETWYSRPVLFVSDVQHALGFYLDTLGFTKKWHEADGTGTVCQVDRGGCEIILCQDPARKDRGRLFIELNRNGIDELRREIVERSVPTEKTWWGYDAIRIVDPDGNELLFPLDETNDREQSANG